MRVFLRRPLPPLLPLLPLLALPFLLSCSGEDASGRSPASGEPAEKGEDDSE